MDPLLLLLVLFQILLVGSRHVGELLCRKCGAHITNQIELLNVTKPETKPKYSYDFPLVGKNTTINVFENPAGETFHVAGCKKAHLKYYGHPSVEATWFPGHQWTICVCPQCGQHLGWFETPQTQLFFRHFEPTEVSGPEREQSSFVGVVLDYLISADYADTMTRTPV